MGQDDVGLTIPDTFHRLFNAMHHVNGMAFLAQPCRQFLRLRPFLLHDQDEGGFAHYFTVCRRHSLGLSISSIFVCIFTLRRPLSGMIHHGSAVFYKAVLMPGTTHSPLKFFDLITIQVEAVYSYFCQHGKAIIWRLANLLNGCSSKKNRSSRGFSSILCTMPAFAGICIEDGDQHGHIFRACVRETSTDAEESSLYRCGSWKRRENHDSGLAYLKKDSCPRIAGMYQKRQLPLSVEKFCVQGGRAPAIGC
jgi:hypothetical protein